MIIDTDDVKQEIKEELRAEIEDLIQDVISDYFAYEIDADTYEVLQEKFRAIIRQQSTSDIIKEHQHEYSQAIKAHRIAATSAPFALLSDKVDALARNMDALYLMVNK